VIEQNAKARWLPLATTLPYNKIDMLMLRSHILIKLVPGFESEALTKIRATPGIVEVSPLFGHWDAIAIGEAESLRALSMLVINQIRGIQGIEQTETLLHGDF